MGKALGKELRSVRRIRGLSLRVVADEADISTAYLQKLEAGEVQQPSPHVLHRLAGALEVPYPTLMELAGYVIPNPKETTHGGSFDHALSSSDLTSDERKAVAAFIAHLREQRNG